MIRLLLVLALGAAAVAQEDPYPDMSPEDLAAAMEKARAVTSPGEHHEDLERFLGTWDAETRFVMAGRKSPPEEGTVTVSWLMDGRWLKFESEGRMMGSPIEGFTIMGYDNFKMSYVTTSVSTMDTAMLRSEGDMTPDGEALVTYGTLDEYLTGEHDKMVKYVWRFVDDDTIVHEIHDLPIGLEHTMVLEMTMTRRGS